MSGRHILIVDDDALSSYALADHLEQLGYQVTVAEKCAGARVALCAPEKVDLMILGSSLSEGQGTEMLFATDPQSTLQRPRVIVSSGIMDRHDVSWEALRLRLPEIARARISACVSKPYTLDSMDAMVNLILSAEDRRAANPSEHLSGDYEALPPAPTLTPRATPRVG